MILPKPEIIAISGQGAGGTDLVNSLATVLRIWDEMAAEVAEERMLP
jgi:hypothetical protein